MTAPEKTSRVWMFRLISVATPVLLGGIFVIWLLFQRGWLVTTEAGIEFRRPPLYLEEPGHEITGHRYLYDTQLGWRNIPDWNATTFQKPLSINANGLRAGRDYSFDKPAGTKRILVLGDSYAWGYGVADQELFSELLERQLASRNGKWQVINSGVSGWGTDQQHLYLKNEGLKYQPDVVVVAFFIGNDIDNNVAATQYGLNKPVLVGSDLTLRNVPVPRPGQPVNPYVLDKLSKLDPVEHSVRIVSAIAEECVANDCELVLMKFGVFLAPRLPYAVDLNRRFTDSVQALGANLKFLDLDEQFAMKGFDLVKLTSGNDDGHWNAFGHQQVASMLETFLVENGMLD